MIAILWATAIGAALIYGLRLLDAPETIARSVTKTLPLAALAVISVQAGAPLLLTLGLGLSAVGDAALSRDGERPFLIGLGAFLLAHVACVVVFLGQRAWALPGAWPLLPAMLVLALGMLRVLWDHLGDMRAAVIAYIAAIFAMGVSAVFTGSMLLIIGALAFTVSDALLATMLFLNRRSPAISHGVWWLYVGGQMLILSAFI